jgi:hypothetical protein
MKMADIDRVLATAPSFYHNYIRKAGEGDLLANMEAQIAEARQFFGVTCKEKLDYRYAEGKWTPTEIIGHLTDGERIFQYRALRFARNDKTDLPGFEENDYVPAANFGARGVASILDEFEYVRRSGIILLRSLSEAELWRSGNANGNPISAYALFYANVGHFNHHVGVIKERYL